MPDTLTPGESASTVYWGDQLRPSLRDWLDLRSGERQRWEAAAPAVLALKGKETP